VEENVEVVVEVEVGLGGPEGGFLDCTNLFCGGCHVCHLLFLSLLLLFVELSGDWSIIS
jgi:hypothetical protein